MTYKCMYTCICMCALACRDKTEQKEDGDIVWLLCIAIVGSCVMCFMSFMYTRMHSCMCVCPYMCVVCPVQCHVEMHARMCTCFCVVLAHGMNA